MKGCSNIISNVIKLFTYTCNYVDINFVDTSKNNTLQITTCTCICTWNNKIGHWMPSSENADERKSFSLVHQTLNLLH